MSSIKDYIGTTFNSISGVSIDDPVTNDVLKYNGSVWVNGAVAVTLDEDLTAIAALSGTSGLLRKTAANTWSLDTTSYLSGAVAHPFEYGVACSDETTALTAGTAKVTFRVPAAFTLTAIRASLSTAQTSGNILTLDVNMDGVSVLSTKLTIDNTEKTSVSATTPAVISTTAITDDAEITVDIDQIGDGTAKGLKITLIGTR